MVLTGPRQLGTVLYDMFGILVTLRPRELSLTAHNVLTVLERNGPVRLGDLAASAVVTQPAMTIMVDQLSRIGFAERLSDPQDGRVVLVALTPQGKRFLNDRRRFLGSWVAEAIAQLSASEAKALDRAIPALRHLVDALANEGSPRP